MPTETFPLLDGYRRFREGAYAPQKRRWEQLAQGQSPPVMIIGCCDSRVDPTMIFDCGPGEVFVLRNVANLVPPCHEGRRLAASAAIEFAVAGLKVQHIVVLGHGSCGGIRAALSGADLGVPGKSFIDDWMSILDEATGRVRAEAERHPTLDMQRALEHEAIRVSLTNLRSFPFVREAEAAGQLKLSGAFFAIHDGVLHLLDEPSGKFSPAE